MQRTTIRITGGTIESSTTWLPSGQRLDAVSLRLTELLARCDGYGARYRAAVERSGRGEAGWVDDMTRDSCHKGWFELHEDLISSLGLTRENEA